jgi:hypothetical protein
MVGLPKGPQYEYHQNLFLHSGTDTCAGIGGRQGLLLTAFGVCFSVSFDQLHVSSHTLLLDIIILLVKR